MRNCKKSGVEEMIGGEFCLASGIKADREAKVKRVAEPEEILTIEVNVWKVCRS